MSENRTLHCRCGAMGWRVAAAARGMHVVCYCADCQAAARHLGAADRLDEAGGTAIFQTLPADVAITRGEDHLSVMQLSPSGLLRWYAGCCGTPIANTLRTPGLPFAGMVLPPDDRRFGPPRAHVQTEAALRPVKAHGFAASGFALLSRALRARLAGRHRETPFFDDGGQPVRTPHVLTREERLGASER